GLEFSEGADTEFFFKPLKDSDSFLDFDTASGVTNEVYAEAGVIVVFMLAGLFTWEVMIFCDVEDVDTEGVEDVDVG
ncbi:17806_t:CDS:1, partial [Racocetra fulgida]